MWKHDSNKFKNMNVAVDLEIAPDLDMWVPIFKLQFKMKPTEYARNTFDDDVFDFQKWLADDILGLKRIQREVERVLPHDWRFYNAFYAMDHNPRKFSFGKQSDFQIDVFLYSPDKYKAANDWKNMLKDAKLIASKIANLDIFQTTKMLEFKA